MRVGVAVSTQTVYFADGSQATAVGAQEFCRTPCVVQRPPGRLALRTGGPRIVPTTTVVDVPPSGLRVALLAPTRWQQARGTTLLLLAGFPFLPGGLAATIGGVVMVASRTPGPQAAGGLILMTVGSSTLAAIRHRDTRRSRSGCAGSAGRLRANKRWMSARPMPCACARVHMSRRVSLETST